MDITLGVLISYLSKRRNRILVFLMPYVQNRLMLAIHITNFALSFL